MVKLTDDMKDMLGTQLAILATVKEDGTPNIGPKRTLRVYDDSHLIYKENTGGEIFKNIKRGSKVAVAVVNREKVVGYRFICTAEYFTEGEYFDFVGGGTKAAVLLTIHEIYDLTSGPKAGTRIA